MMIGIVLLAISPLYLIIHLIAKARANRRAEEAEAAERHAKWGKEAAKREAQSAAAAQRQREQDARKAAAEKKQAEKEAKKAEAHARKLARAQELTELAERRLKAEKELTELRSGRPETISEAPAEAVEDAQEPAAEPSAEPVEEPREVPGITLDGFMDMIQPKPFKGQIVAFTGRLTLSGMTRAQAIEKVRQAGGQAYKNLYTSSTLLVVGTNPGMTKMDKADRWIGSVHKITERQFLDMFTATAPA